MCNIDDCLVGAAGECLDDGSRQFFIENVEAVQGFVENKQGLLLVRGRVATGVVLPKIISRKSDREEPRCRMHRASPYRILFVGG